MKFPTGPPQCELAGRGLERYAVPHNTWAAPLGKVLPSHSYLKWNRLTGPLRRGTLGRWGGMGWGLVYPVRFQTTRRKA